MSPRSLIGDERMKKAQPDLSVCMIVKNEARQIAEALENFQVFADEIVVVDTGSTDTTKSIVERFTPCLFDYPWGDDFSSARNFSLEKAQGRYLIWLDADDRFDRAMQQKVRALKAHLHGNCAYYFILESTDAKGSTQSCYQLRCLPRMPGIHFGGRVHEQIYPSVLAAGLQTATTDIVISHVGYHDQDVWLRKARRNLRLLERERDEGRDDEHLHYYLATTYKMLDRDGEAMAAMERALSQLKQQLFQSPQGMGAPDFRPTLEALLFLASLHLKQGNAQQALRQLMQADALPCQDAFSHFRMGCLFQELDRHAPAINHLGSSLEGGPRVAFHPSTPLPARSQILLFIVYSLLCLDQDEKAIETLKMAYHQDLKLREGWEWLGCRALKQGQPHVALKAYEHALATGELSASGYCNLGILHGRQGSPEKALAFYRTALEKDPHHRDVMANIAHLYFSLGRLKEARMAFHQLIAAGARDLDIFLALTVIAVRQRDMHLVETTTQMIKAISSLHHSCKESGTEMFFADLARQYAVEAKPQLMNWANEIADGLRRQGFTGREAEPSNIGPPDLR